ncbi:MAG: MFS transporter [Planctomycetia bacterium]|nr:MFS transporter [Planctomycetia bacterium]
MPGRHAYRTSPSATAGMPPGVPFIVGNEAAERFSYYGMKAILVIFMTTLLAGRDGTPAPMNAGEAKFWYHAFSSAVYFFPLVGAIVADLLLGKYPTIMLLSLVYCAGHAALALDETRSGLLLGLALIAVGSGGIKPCVSAHVGDQFGPSNENLLPRVFSWFYFAINLGAFVSSLLTPWLLESFGPGWAFGVPGLFMAAATVIFWLGRHSFVHVPPAGPGAIREACGPEARAALGRLALVYVFVAVFWALFDQTGSSWVLQATKLDRSFAGIEWLPSQIQAVNPLLVLAFIPLFSTVVWPALERIMPLPPLSRIALGLFLAAASFAIVAAAEWRIEAGTRPTIGWQLAAYAVLTAAEIMVSVTCLEFSYTQAPLSLKSLVMGLYLLSVSAGNLLAAGVNWLTTGADGLPLVTGTTYYLLFAGLMLATAVCFLPVAAFLPTRRYIRPEER